MEIPLNELQLKPPMIIGKDGTIKLSTTCDKPLHSSHVLKKFNSHFITWCSLGSLKLLKLIPIPLLILRPSNLNQSQFACTFFTEITFIK